MAYFVHDAFNAPGVAIRSFNAYHLRMIASSRKKTDRRDAYWSAEALQTGMTPHPVYLPPDRLRQLDASLPDALPSCRSAAVAVARPLLSRSRGVQTHADSSSGSTAGRVGTDNPQGLDADLYEALMLCQRMDETLALEQKRIEETLFEQAGAVDAVKRLMTIPDIGIKVATMIYVWVGDVSRFPDKHRCS